jgi:hypothetical protein
MENSTLVSLPENEQVVNIKIDYLSYNFIVAQYFAENQTFVIQASGLIVSAVFVNYWEGL